MQNQVLQNYKNALAIRWYSPIVDIDNIVRDFKTSIKIKKYDCTETFNSKFFVGKMSSHQDCSPKLTIKIILAIIILTIIVPLANNTTFVQIVPFKS